jgi:hypothetical protein
MGMRRVAEHADAASSHGRRYRERLLGFRRETKTYFLRPPDICGYETLTTTGGGAWDAIRVQWVAVTQ